MKNRAQYTIFLRKFPSKNVYYYYRTYDEDGNLTTPKSTGQKTNTAAKRFCEELLKLGDCIPTMILYLMSMQITGGFMTSVIMYSVIMNDLILDFAFVESFLSDFAGPVKVQLI